MPKNSSAFLTGRFGLITDYLAEAFHHQLKQSPGAISTAAAGPIKAATPVIPAAREEPAQPSERHYTIAYGDTGYSYDTIFGPYFVGAKSVTVEDPYIRMPHQVANFVRFCEAVVKAATVRNVRLITSYDQQTDMAGLQEKLEELKQSLLEYDVALEIRLNDKMHDREVRLDNGWTVKIGRGLDFYQKPEGWFAVGATDLSLRRCLETKVDVFRHPVAPGP